MADEIVNRVAQSKLVTINLEDFYPEGARIQIDVSDWLEQGFLLREKDFRTKAQEHEWEQYANKYVALYCSTDAIIPAWAYMLLTTYLSSYARKVVVGDLEMLESVLYQEQIAALDVSAYQDLPVIIKGCSDKPVPKNAYLFLIQKLQPIVKSMMYGEACSSVPLYKRKK
ncbi:DUF2480 family protein [Zhouia amylolytica]|uniref:DUF2480 family protein n=1 Tax=Zhouia amylolytica AD3 TaxID=1286632 RepID=W2UJ39_9FLAO|nr:DUF2480 family protein [Zhouia amylolytica]ETN94170.1 hypothetical protein P278_29740 [Zhouia amylolytica AD3]